MKKGPTSSKVESTQAILTMMKNLGLEISDIFEALCESGAIRAASSGSRLGAEPLS